ncbi:MAG TPA: hypothetical protein V6D47_11570 [Oscillatoriaceae cyanobacterium]
MTEPTQEPGNEAMTPGGVPLVPQRREDRRIRTFGDLCFRSGCVAVLSAFLFALSLTEKHHGKQEDPRDTAIWWGLFWLFCTGCYVVRYVKERDRS